MKEIEKIVISRVKNAIVPHHQTGARNTMDCRSSCGISFSLGGEAVYTQNGEAFVSDANTVIFHPEGASYDMRCTKGGAFALINFHIQNPSFERFIAVRISDMALLKSKFAELQEAAMLGESAPRVMRIMYEIVELINEESREGENTVLSFAVGVIKERYMEQSFNIALLAAAVHVSESYLRRLFSSVYGIEVVGVTVGIHQIFGKISSFSGSAKFIVNIDRKRIVKCPLDIFQKLRYTMRVDSAMCKGNAIFSDLNIR